MVFVAAHNILSPFGLSAEATFAAIAAGRSAVAAQPAVFAGDGPVWAAKLPAEWADDALTQEGALSKFEKMLLTSISAATAPAAVDLTSPRTVFIFASTKGSISLVEEGQAVTPARLRRMQLYTAAQVVTRHFRNPVPPVVISNACISGVTALLTAQRLLESGQYDAAVVAGADTVGKFVLSGFQAFQALSAGRCKPFSEDRDGINLGEAAATMVLTTQAPAGTDVVRLSGGATSNDANHISGPSRSGAELAQAIAQALRLAGLAAADVDFISAHGTATNYNDAMEAKAFALTGLLAKPVHSVKGALGHTLGAAGIVESVLSVLALRQGRLLPTVGYSQPMLSHPLNVLPAAANAPLRVQRRPGF
jgi:3-oxoacyl-[acyl-carrier-protein] synthase-1